MRLGPFRLRARADRGGAGATPSVAAEVLKVATAGLLALAALTGITALILDRVSETEAINDAKRVTRVLATSVVQPAVDDALITASTEARQRIDGIVRRRVLTLDVVRVKIWRPDGTIVYSDEPRLIGSRYTPASGPQRALRTGTINAGVSDLSLPEHRFERHQGKLLEVYLPIRTPGGHRLLFETYQRFSTVTASGHDLLARLAPALLGALVAFAVLQLPLAWSLARRLQRGHRQREALLQRALDASDLERRRIAGDLHDGVVQDLAAAAFSLTALREDRRDGNGSQAALEKAAGACRGAVRQLRSLLVEIYPPRLREAGLDSALADLVAPLQERGIEATVEIESRLDMPDRVEALFFRVAQEALRNVAKHARAGQVRVRVGHQDGLAALSVRDDGRGFPLEEAMVRQQRGHLGLRLLRDLATDAGGRLEIDSHEGQGTTVRVEAPLR
jgi:two-component system NarL family sensor kinase